MDSVLQSINRIAERHPHMAIRLYQNFELAAQAARQSLLQLEALYQRYFLLERFGQITELKDQLESGLYLAEQSKLPLHAGRMMEGLARIHYTCGEYREAMQYWMRCIDICALSGDPYALVEARIGLGQIYTAMNAWETAARFLRDAGDILSTLDAPYLSSKQAINLGVNLLALGETEAARQEFDFSLQQATRAGAIQYVAESYWYLAEVQVRAQQWEQAEALILKALAVAKDCDYVWLRSAAVETLAKIYIPQARYAEITAAYEEALQLTLQTGARKQQADCYAALSNLAELRGDVQLSLHYVREQVKVQTELSQLSANDRFRELRQYDISRQPPIEKLLKLSADCNSDGGKTGSILQHIAQSALTILDVEWVGIWLLNTGTRFYECQAHAGDAAIQVSLGQAIATASMPNYASLMHGIHAPVVAHDVRLHPAAAELESILAMEHVQSLLELPVRLHGEHFGVISFAQINKRRNWSRDDVLYGSHLSNIIERVLAEEEHLHVQSRLRRHNEGLEKRVTRRTSELKAANEALEVSLQQVEQAHYHISQLSEVGRKITATLEQDSIMACITEHLHDLMEVELFCVGFYRQPLGLFDFEYTTRHRQVVALRPIEGETLQELAQWCMQQQHYLRIADDVEHDVIKTPLTVLEKILAINNSHAAIMMPFTLENRVTGVIYVACKKPSTYQRMHVDMLTTLAAYIKVALDNAETYQQLQFAQQHLVAQEKMAALGSLVAGISHELNTPIGNSLLCASTLEDISAKFITQLQKNQIKRSDLQNFCDSTLDASTMLTRNLSNAADLVSSFKQVAVDQSSAQRREFDLRETSQDVIRTLQQQITKKGHSLQLDIPSHIRLDSFPGSYGQILINLINNAMLHAFDQGQHGHMHLHAFVGNKDLIHIHFHDDGMGILPANLPKIFDPFYTTKLGKGGSGLGLSIVYNIVTSLLGGSIHVESEQHRGTEFALVLPRVAPHLHLPNESFSIKNTTPQYNI